MLIEETMDESVILVQHSKIVEFVHLRLVVNQEGGQNDHN